VAADRRGEPAREEIESYAADAGISKETARKELLDQRKLPALVEGAQERLGGAYAGLWIDGDGSRHIILAVTDDAPPEAEADACAVAATVGLADRVEIVRREHSERELELLRRTIDRELVRVNRDAPSTVDVEVDLAASAVIVRRTPRAATAAQRRYLDSVRARYGSVVRLAKSPGVLKRLPRGPAGDP
jgi:hypothetical protein